MNRIEFPKDCPHAAEEMIRSLCMKKPEERVAMRQGGIKNLMGMVFFEEFSWSDLQALAMTAPFVPSPPNYEKIKQRKLTRALDINWDEVVEWVEAPSSATT